MILDRIILENFRQYFGRQRLEFAKDPQHNVTVIHGVNGAGKTSLFLAINWCLYGKSVDNIKVIENVGELVSKEAISRAVKGEEVRTSIEISFSHNGGRYIIKRSIYGIKKENNLLSINDADDFTMMRILADGQAERVPNPIGTMNAILPVNVREYFLFDGEKIDNFAKPEATAQVKDAIYLVLKLEILQRSRRHLDSLASDYRRELKRISGGEIREQIEKAEKARSDRSLAEQRLDELKVEIESARSKISQIDQKLRESQNAKALQEQRDRVERDLILRRTELEQAVERIREIASVAYIFRAQTAINRACKILDQKRDRGEIPSSIRRQFVQDLIEQRICICGRAFYVNSAEHQQLLKLMTDSLPGNLEDDVLDTSATLRSFNERIARQEVEIKTVMQQRTNLVSRITELEAELDDIGRQLKGSPLEEISRLEKQREEFRADVDSYNIELGQMEMKIEELTKEINRLDKDVVKAQKQKKQAQLLTLKLDLAQRTADAIGEIYQAFADDMRSRIEAKTREIFKLLIWKDSHFQDVQLGPDFHLEVIDRYGLPARPELSAGERQVLSLSFITAMSRISEEEAPLVMDTPFGRLSSHHRNSITEHLPLLAAQLALFVTDEELRDEARQNLEPRIGAEYKLEFNRKTSCTEIVEI